MLFATSNRSRTYVCKVISNLKKIVDGSIKVISWRLFWSIKLVEKILLLIMQFTCVFLLVVATLLVGDNPLPLTDSPLPLPPPTSQQCPNFSRTSLPAQGTCTVVLDELQDCTSQDANLFAELLIKDNNDNIGQIYRPRSSSNQ